MQGHRPNSDLAAAPRPDLPKHGLSTPVTPCSQMPVQKWKQQQLQQQPHFWLSFVDPFHGCRKNSRQQTCPQKPVSHNHEATRAVPESPPSRPGLHQSFTAMPLTAFCSPAYQTPRRHGTQHGPPSDTYTGEAGTWEVLPSKEKIRFSEAPLASPLTAACATVSQN